MENKQEDVINAAEHAKYLADNFKAFVFPEEAHAKDGNKVDAILDVVFQLIETILAPQWQVCGMVVASTMPILNSVLRTDRELSTYTKVILDHATERLAHWVFAPAKKEDLVADNAALANVYNTLASGEIAELTDCIKDRPMDFETLSLCTYTDEIVTQLYKLRLAVIALYTGVHRHTEDPAILAGVRTVIDTYAKQRCESWARITKAIKEQVFAAEVPPGMQASLTGCRKRYANLVAEGVKPGDAYKAAVDEMIKQATADGVIEQQKSESGKTLTDEDFGKAFDFDPNLS